MSMFRKQTVADFKRMNLSHAAAELEKALCKFEDFGATEISLIQRIERLRTDKPIPGREDATQENLDKALLAYETAACEREMAAGHVAAFRERIARIQRELKELEPKKQGDKPANRAVTVTDAGSIHTHNTVAGAMVVA